VIDEARAAERVEAMHKSASENLARALAVERHLATVLERREFDTAYNPEVSTLLVRYRLGGSNAYKNMVELVKRGAGQSPLSITNGVAAHMVFDGGFFVVLKAEVEGRTRLAAVAARVV